MLQTNLVGNNYLIALIVSSQNKVLWKKSQPKTAHKKPFLVFDNMY